MEHCAKSFDVSSFVNFTRNATSIMTRAQKICYEKEPTGTKPSICFQSHYIPFICTSLNSYEFIADVDMCAYVTYRRSATVVWQKSFSLLLCTTNKELSFMLTERLTNAFLLWAFVVLFYPKLSHCHVLSKSTVQILLLCNCTEYIEWVFTFPYKSNGKKVLSTIESLEWMGSFISVQYNR